VNSRGFQALVSQLGDLTAVLCEALITALKRKLPIDDAVQLIDTKFQADPCCGHAIQKTFAVGVAQVDRTQKNSQPNDATCKRCPTPQLESRTGPIGLAFNFTDTSRLVACLIKWIAVARKCCSIKRSRDVVAKFIDDRTTASNSLSCKISVGYPQY
jgi:hypothetical protein